MLFSIRQVAFALFFIGHIKIVVFAYRAIGPFIFNRSNERLYLPIMSHGSGSKISVKQGNRFISQGPRMPTRELGIARKELFHRLSVRLRQKSNTYVVSPDRYELANSLESELQFSKTDLESAVAVEYAQVYIQFSLCFLRYIVYTHDIGNHTSLGVFLNGSVLASFPFLDQALEHYPNATLVVYSESHLENHGISLSSLHIQTIAKFKTIHHTRQKSTPAATVEESNNLTPIDMLAHLVQPKNHFTGEPYFDINTTKAQLIKMIPKDRFHPTLTPEKIHEYYETLIEIFTRYHGTSEASIFEHGVGLAFSRNQAKLVLSAFPHLVTYPPKEVEERIRFFLQPMPTNVAILPGKETETPFSKNHKQFDWPALYSCGYGANFTIDQLTNCIRAVPEILALHHCDSTKPSVPYFLNNWKISSERANEVQSKLNGFHLSSLPLSGGLLGCTPADPYFFAFLHSQGVSWDSIKIIINAIPTITQCDTQISWDVDGPVCRKLKLPVLNFMRERLDLSPADIFHMIRTHSRLSGYNIQTRIKPSLDAIQSSLGMSNFELRSLIMRMPSLLGMSVLDKSDTQKSSLSEKLSFFYNEAGMDQSQLRKAVQRQPALLQYSIEGSLRPKLQYLTRDLEIDLQDINRIIYTSPAIMGMSLEHNLKPTVAIIADSCCLSLKQVGTMVSTCPPILTLSIKRKILPCLTFLKQKLNLSNTRALGAMLMTTPRLLIHSVDSSLSPKLLALEDAVRVEIGQDGHERNSGSNPETEAVFIVKNNPSLLVLSNTVFSKRLEKILSSSTKSLRNDLRPSKKGRPKLANRNTEDLSINLIQDSPDLVDSNSRLSMSRYIPISKFDLSSYSDTIQITLLVSGSVYPPEGSGIARGIRKSNGVSLLFPQVSRFKDSGYFEDLVYAAAHSGFGQILPEGHGTNLSKGIICIGNTILKPSCRRCDLYACHAGLKLCLQILKLSGYKTLGKHFSINIYTSSQYAWDILRDPERLSKWAMYSDIHSLKTALFEDQEMPIPLFNVDLLHPLSQTFSRIIDNDGRLTNGSKSHHGKASIKFGHTNDYDSPFQGDYKEEIFYATSAARKAAIWQFECARDNVFRPIF